MRRERKKKGKVQTCNSRIFADFFEFVNSARIFRQIMTYEMGFWINLHFQLIFFGHMVRGRCLAGENFSEKKKDVKRPWHKWANGVAFISFPFFVAMCIAVSEELGPPNILDGGVSNTHIRTRTHMIVLNG